MKMDFSDNKRNKLTFNRVIVVITLVSVWKEDGISRALKEVRNSKRAFIELVTVSGNREVGVAGGILTGVCH
jgi:hypothetical protein